eukprot:4231891-Pleurochrysis_carterae.AAC.2
MPSPATQPAAARIPISLPTSPNTNCSHPSSFAGGNQQGQPEFTDCGRQRAALPLPISSRSAPRRHGKAAGKRPIMYHNGRNHDVRQTSTR